MTKRPSTTAPDGRGPNGRFLPGNRAARGNPLASRVARLRVAALEEVSQADMRRVIRKLVDLAVQGDVAAAREVLSRVLGPPVELDLIARIENLESALARRES